MPWYNAPLAKLAGVFMHFTIRELVLVTVIAAVGLGWWFDHRRLSEKGWVNVAEALANALRMEGYKVEIQRQQVLVTSSRGTRHLYHVGPHSEELTERIGLPDYSYFAK